MDTINKRPVLSSALIALLAASFITVILGLQGLGSPLYWWHVAIGDLIASWQRIPDQQLFLFTVPPDEPAVYASWLGSVLLATTHELGGPELNLLLRNLFCALSVGLLTFFVARRTDRLLAVISPLVIVGTACFFFTYTGPAFLALPPATLALIGLFMVLERPARIWPAIFAPVVVLLIINIDFATALVIIAASLAVAFHLTRRASDKTDGGRIYIAAGLCAASLPALFGFAYGPRFWALAMGSIEFTALAAPAAVVIAFVAASKLTTRGVSMPRTSRLVLLLLPTLVLAAIVQPGVPTRAPIVTAIDGDLRTEPPLVGVMSAELPLRCAEHLRRTGRELRVFHDRDYAGFLLYHLIDAERPHSLLFDDHRGLLDEDILEMAELIRTEPVARGLFVELGVNAAVHRRDAYPTLTEDLSAAPDWHDLAEGIGDYACFISR